jgi:nicotinate dehydrogenase subunit B
MARNYVWPYQMHALHRPFMRGGRLAAGAVDSLGRNPKSRMCCASTLSRLTGLADVSIDIIRMEAAGCYGRNCADDVAADAALLSRAVGSPVRVQLMRANKSMPGSPRARRN